ncbi:MAG: Sec-independent protein translocase protein TatB [Acidimicrobiales bacterium]
MFNIGGGEVVVIALVALIVLGPQRLPDAARQAGKMLADLRRLSSGFQDELKGAFDDSAINGPAIEHRESMGSVPADSSAMSSAIASVSEQHPPRRTPLQAAPNAEPAKSTRAKKAGNKPAKRPSAEGK